jgi:hypothetical protein
LVMEFERVKKQKSGVKKQKSGVEKTKKWG